MAISDSFVAVIPAAGKGQRLGGIKPKQYLELGGITILEASTKYILKEKSCKGVCIVINNNDKYWNTLTLVDHPKIFFIEGGETRMQSSINGVNFWLNKGTEFNNILVHDAVRPCLTNIDLVNLLNSFNRAKRRELIDGMILATKCKDTIKVIKKNSLLIEQTIDRETLWQASTPQIFTKEAFIQALSFYKTRNDRFTDESSLIESSGGIINLLEGSSSNIKITTKEDLIFAKTIISNKKK